MTQLIHVCTRGSKGSLRERFAQKFRVDIDDIDDGVLQVTVCYKDARYVVQGNCFWSYIVTAQE